MKILITGAKGYIGGAIYRHLKSKNIEASGIDIYKTHDIDKIDISNEREFKNYLVNYKPSLVIHTGAIKDLISCENNKLKAFSTNTLSTEFIVDYSKEYNQELKVIYFSSDVVFDGKRGNYNPTDRPNPINWYGKTKMFSEIILKNISNFAILRTALVIGNLNGNYKKLLNVELENEILQNQTLLPQYIYERLRNKKSILLPKDIISNPTHINQIIEIIDCYIENFIPGIFHTAGATQISRYDFAVKIANRFGFDKALIKVDNKQIVKIRPKNISLDVTDSLKKLCIDQSKWSVDKYLKLIDF